MEPESSLLKAVKAFVLWQFNNIRNQSFRLNRNDQEYTKFHSQFGEDRWIFNHINLPKNGVFVDIGAGHPIHLSNTYFFEKNGWTGLCVDADPAQYKVLKEERAKAEWAAISLQEGKIKFSRSYLPELSSSLERDERSRWMKIPFKDTIQVPSTKLETLLEKHNIIEIDLLDIDVEGTELEVWKTFDYKKHKPKVVIIEHYTLGLPNHSLEIKDFFSSLPYQLVYTTCANFIFLSLDAHKQ